MRHSLANLALVVSAADLGIFQKLLFRKSVPHAVRHLPTDHPEFMYSKLSPEQLRQPRNGETFDYIIVGGGGAGCPLARTLADGGFKVALLERGDLRENHPNSWTLHGSGASLMDSSITQAVVTTDGYISHIGSVLGGGTSVNLGFYIEGNDADFVSQFKHKSVWDRASQWVRERIAFPARIKSSYYQSLDKYVQELVPKTIDLSYEYQRETNWRGATLFNDTDQFRHAADTLLGPIEEFPASLILSVNTTVKNIRFSRDPKTRVLSAQCVEFVTTSGSSESLLGRKESIVHGLQNKGSLLAWFNWYPNIAKFIGIDTTLPSQDGINRSVCLNEKQGSEIIMSAGAILTPDLLYRSGVGPVEITTKLGITNLLNVPYLGKLLGDRVFLPLAFFFKEYIPDSFQPSLLQRVALWTPKPSFDERSSKSRQRLQEENIADREFDDPGRAKQSRLSELDELLGGVMPRKCESDAPPLRDEKSMSWEEAADSRGLQSYYEIESRRSIQNKTLQQASLQSYPHLSGFEELSGGMMATGCSIATRYFFAPPLRSHVMVDTALETLYACSTHLDFGGQHDILSLCPIIRPILECFRKAAALVYMMPEPVSLGELDIGGSDGKTLLVTGNYLKEEEDQEAGTLGLADILQKLYDTNAFDDMFESYKDHATKCPKVMRDTMSSLFFKLTDYLGSYVSEAETESALMSIDDLSMFSELEGHSHYKGRVQKFASFPPKLPDPWNYAQVEQFLQKSATSMWHWHGSARMGAVVDQDFRLAGTDRLSIVDASVIGRLTKMNPQVAVMIMGRYAGIIKLLARYSSSQTN